MTNYNKFQKIVDKLFHLFEQGEWDEAAKLFAEDAQIIQQFGKKVTAITVNDFVKNAKHGPLSKLGAPVYLNRRVVIHGAEGFLEQHTSQLTINGQAYEIPACLVGKFDGKGKITLLEEYLDPSPLIAALRTPKSKK